MKRSHIFAIVVIGIAIGIIITTAGDASSYVTFNEAQSLAQNGNDKMIHVVGTLKKGPDNEIIGIEESPDKLSFRFLMEDQSKEEQIVYYPNPVPQDFDKSEQVVVVGSFKDQTFIAEKILLKCPSKYQEEQINI